MTSKSQTCGNLQPKPSGESLLKAQWNSLTGGLAIFADLWNSGTCKNLFQENAILLTDLALQHLPHLQKLSNYTKVNKHFQLLKMDLNHKNIYLSWALVQIYTFNQEITPICAHIWRHISYSAAAFAKHSVAFKKPMFLASSDMILWFFQFWNVQ